MRLHYRNEGLWAHVAVVVTLVGLFVFLAYTWTQKGSASGTPQPTHKLTPIQEASGVIRQITSCLVNPTVPVGKPLKHIDGTDLKDRASAYFYTSPTQIYPVNASGEYLHRELYCQASVK